VKTTKDKLESRIDILDILLLVFAALVAVGVTGEYVYGYSRFGQLTAVGVGGEAVLGFLNFLQNRRLRGLQELEIVSLKRDVAESNRLAEQDRLARMKIEERLAPRQLTEKNRDAIIPLLRQFADAGRLVDIIKYPNDAEVDALTYQVLQVLRDAAWKPTVYGPASSKPMSGIVVEFDPKNPSTRNAATALHSALTDAGLNPKGPNPSLPRHEAFTAPPGTPPAGASIRLTIGSK
jgi:hypothetical protein